MPAVLFAGFTILVVVVYLVMIGSYTIALTSQHQVFHHGWHERVVPVSVIIAVRNEEMNMDRLLEGLLAQDYPRGSFEILVSDDHSEDGTLQKVAGFAALHPELPLQVVLPGPGDDGRPGKKGAIARAVARAQGEVLLFTDADTLRGPAWISAMVSAFPKHGITMVLGPVVFTAGEDLFGRMQQLEFLGLMGTTAGSALAGHPVMSNGANLAYRKDAFFEAGGFRRHAGFASGDDQFMMSAIRKQYGHGAVFFNFDPQAVVTTRPQPTLAAFLGQRLRWVSKSRGYRDPAVMGVGAITYLVHLLLLSGLFAGIFYPPLLLILAALWLFKISLEFPMVWITGRLFGIRPSPGVYLLAQLFQLIYVPIVGLLGQILPYRWKGRMVRR